MTFAHIHAHSEFSPLDGLSLCKEIAERAAADGNPAAAITDHGACAGHPEFQRTCDAAGVKPIFGMETYWVPNRISLKGDTKDRSNKHMVLLAATQQGLKDLWALSTEAYATGFYHRPRCDWDLLDRYGQDLIMTTACLGGVISRDVLSGHYTAASDTLARLRSIFRGRLYLEIQPNDLPEQIRLNKLLATISEHTGLPLVAAADSHYPSPEKTALHRTWMACRTSPANEDYWHFDPMHTEEQVRENLAYLDARIVDEAIRNTMVIAEQCNARIGSQADPPVATASPQQDATTLKMRCLAALDTISYRGGSKRDYTMRLEEEFRLVADKNLAGCYLIVDDICSWVRSQGILIGPGRGSAAGSLMSYLLGITIADPLETGLMFGRFLTPGRTALPDFDMDFPSSKREMIQNRVFAKYGEPNVVRVGTHVRYRSKGILQKLFALNANDLPPEAFPDAHRIAQIIDEAEAHTAGLGLPWDELLDQADELREFIERYTAIFNTAGMLVGRIHAWGKHPAGLVISTGAPLEGTIPMRTPSPEDPTLVSQWDFRDMEEQGLLKLDFLTLRTLDSVQAAIELIAKRTGQRPDPATWDVEYRDPQVWDEISSGHTLGMFQIETTLGAQLCRRMKPGSLAELADVNALVRPGPRNSGMAESYLRRRAGTEEVVYPHAALREFLEGRFGVMLYQEDILRACTVLADYDGAEADVVRKVLGKKLTDKIDAAGAKFTERCEANGLERADAEALWATMAEFGRYAFNLAHAYSYGMLAYWTAWLKAHYPVETIAAICSTVDDKDRIAPYITDARRLGITVLPPHVNKGLRGFSIEDSITMRYGLDAIKGVGDQALSQLARGQPFASWDQFRTSGIRSDIKLALVKAGAIDDLVLSRREVVEWLEADREGELVRCIHKDVSASGPNGLPCTFDWASEPVVPRFGKTGRELLPIIKPPPKKCTIACRNYTPPPAWALDGRSGYSPAELWRLEHETFGTWLSDAVFAQLDRVAPDGRALSREIGEKWDTLPEGAYLVPAVIAARRPAHTRTGRRMFWVTLGFESSYIDMAAFSPRDEDEADPVEVLRFMQEGTLVLATAEKQRYKSRGAWRMSSRLISIRRLS